VVVLQIIRRSIYVTYKMHVTCVHCESVVL
jgi:hypothetical protein